MKILHILPVILLLEMACKNSPVSQGTADSGRPIDSATYTQQRIGLSDTLTHLRDTIDDVITNIKKKQENMDKATTAQLEQTIHDLMLDKDRINRNLEVVNLTSHNDWDNNQVVRIREELAIIRGDIQRLSAGK